MFLGPDNSALAKDEMGKKLFKRLICFSGNSQGRRSLFSPHAAISISVATACFLTPFIASAVNIAFTPIGKDFQLSTTELSYLAITSLLTCAVLLLPFGRLADIYSRKKLFLMGALISALSSLTQSVAISHEFLFAGRFLQGISDALISSCALPLLLNNTPRHLYGITLGINTAVVYLGLSLGPSLGGLLISFWGWRSIFALGALLGTAALLFGLKGLPKETETPLKKNFDLCGAILYGITVFLFVFGLSNLPDWKGLIAIGASLFVLIWFIFNQAHKENPLLDYKIFTENRVFAFGNMAGFTNYAATFTVSFLFGIYFQQVRQMQPLWAGIFLLTQPIVQALCSPLAGKMADRKNPIRVAAAGAFLCASGLMALSFLDKDTPIVVIFSFQALMGLGVGFFATPNTKAVMDSVKKADYGTAAGVLATHRLIGMSFSMGVLSCFLAWYQPPGTPFSSSSFLNAQSLAYIFYSVLSLLGMLACILPSLGAKTKIP